MAIKSWIASVNKISNISQTGTPAVAFEGVQQVKPAAALAHEASCGHSVSVRADTFGGKRTKLLLDYPMPFELYFRSWRCSTCRNAKHSRVVSCPVLPSDITLRFAGSVVYISKKYGITYMSIMFLLNLLSMVYEILLIAGMWDGA